MVTFGISTWSIHRSLRAGTLALPDVPAAVREHGMTDLQLCHFHLPTRGDACLAELRRSIDAAGVTLDALLIDFGDLSHPARGEADAAEMEGWLVVAAKLGARSARVAAGSQPPTDEALRRSADRLLRLADAGDRLGVRVVTENWHALLPSSREVLRLIELTGARVPLCIDFGNWSGPRKYDELAAIAPGAVTAHAKCAFDVDGTADAADFKRCCGVLRAADFAGTIAMIYDGSIDDEWRFIAEELAMARAVWA